MDFTPAIWVALSVIVYELDRIAKVMEAALRRGRGEE